MIASPGRAIRKLGLVSFLCGMAAGALAGGAPAAAGPPTCWGVPATIADHKGKIVGTAADDVIVGDDGDNVIIGKGGDDRICGLDGKNTIKGGAGKDELFGLWGNDTLKGGAGDDELYGWSGDDILDGGDDNDYLIGEGDDDVVRGGEGDDDVYGDGLFVENGNDTLEGGPGDDHIVGDLGDDTLDGGDGEDFLLADVWGTDGTEGGDDVLHGGDHDDELYGNDGNDDLFGEGGTDALEGGAGTDFCAQDGKILTACDLTSEAFENADVDHQPATALDTLDPTNATPSSKTAVDDSNWPNVTASDDAPEQGDTTRPKGKDHTDHKRGGKHRKH